MKKKLVILIVDDNMNFIERMISMLDELDNIGYINVANNYDEAHRSLAAEKPDLVLLDINLPGKNGIELLRKIKQSEWNCQVIMITNHVDEYYREQCSELGATHFLDKSNDFGLVPLIIDQWNQN
jgi:DNA-binding NarL/FixJ family response regulator